MCTEYTKDILAELPDYETMERALEQFSRLKEHSRIGSRSDIQWCMGAHELNDVSKKIAEALGIDLDYDRIANLLPSIIEAFAPK